MKKRIALLSLVVLMLIAIIGITTYARYQSKGAGAGTATIAKWAVMVNDQDITATGETTFPATISWTGNSNVKSGYIAPGVTGTASIEIDPQGSQVAMNYYIDITEPDFGNSHISVSGVKVNNIDLTLIAAAAGKCSNEAHTTQETCTGGETWTADPHAGMYTGTIALPASGTMTSTEAVTATVSVTWEDLNTDAANQEDTSTGVETDGSTENITIHVIAEQKVD